MINSTVKIFIHLIGNRVIAFSGRAIGTSSDHEMRADTVRSVKQLVDVAYPIADMNASTWIKKAPSVAATRSQVD